MAQQTIMPADVVENLGDVVEFFNDIDCDSEAQSATDAILCIVDLQNDIVALQMALYKLTDKLINESASSA